MTAPTPPRVLAVTGGASGIGLATATHWLAQDPAARVVLLDLRPDTLDEAVGRLGDRARGVATDVTDRASVDAAFASIAETESALHGLVNCAGNFSPATTTELEDEDWGRLIDIHLGGTLRASRAAHDLLAATRGAIVNLASVAAVLGMPRRASYNSAKHGIVGLTKSLAVEWAAHGIRVNAVGPGYVLTPSTAMLKERGELDTAPLEQRIPVRRLAGAEEIAKPIAWLLGPDASYVTGHTLMVDGGMTVAGEWYPDER
ncbi:SDR family NAD(P)-dependent oxidoreductase [Gulosibacter sp. 10]|uniref:SDR family NAD(P)-dependent oxidoreductase n=1 Tax=Gulosibacter sp. 10 TaxID=1255570 RepID=UPI00097EEBC5|nr:SDR family NAD(P)-dependent oxidoreductase [Gulosibacter sp. 10]SJM71078.1 3-oxoacyl-[acyl-carrier protein] reductase [Gulosibacter sp. 10]